MPLANIVWSPAGFVVFCEAILSALAGLVSLSVFTYALCCRRPRVMPGEVHDVTILAAHQDDCVVLAGEYAIEAARRAKQVHIIYLTCGAPNVEDERVAIRRAECEAAWSMLGPATVSLHFFDLPQSDVKGPAKLLEADLSAVKAKVTAVIESLPQGAAVFLPASGESHCDHRALRQIAFNVLTNTSRSDLRAFEAPEYNDYYSLLHCPLRTVRYVLAQMPFLGRHIRRHTSHTRAGFISGDQPYTLQPDSTRVSLKRAMLKKFSSENGEMLIRYFGFPDWFRPVQCGKSSDAHTGVYLSLGHRYLSPSVICIWISIWGILATLLTAATSLVSQLWGIQSSIAMACIILCVVVLKCTKASEPERRICDLVVASAAIVGVLMSF